MAERALARSNAFLETAEFRGPGWLEDLRRAAMELADRLAWPDRSSEDWRFTRWQDLVPPEWTGDEGTEPRTYPETQLELASLVPDARELWRSATMAVLSEEREKALSVHGVTSAEVSKPTQSWLGSLLERGKDRFDALALASVADGAWVEVADGARLARPVVLRRSTGEGPWTSTLSRAQLGRGSRGTLIVFDRNEASERASHGTDHLEVELQDGAEWVLVFVQALDGDVRRLQRTRIVLGDGAAATVYRLDFGGGVLKTETTLRILGSDARAVFRGALLLGGTQHVEIDTLQDHATPGSQSDLLVKSVVGNEARAVYRGRIWIHHGAQRTDAYQANRNLLLSRRAHVHSIPMLDIEANDVRCTHGSASGPIDEDQIFYMSSRGLREEEARRLIVEGFVAEVLEGIEQERIGSALETALNAKLAALL